MTRVPRDEVAAPESLRGFAERPDLAAVEFTGADCAAFLHRLLTADVAGLSPGHGRASLLLDTRGHVLVSMQLLRLPDRLVAITAAEAAPVLTQALQRYILGADVGIAERTEWRLATLLGEPPAAASALGLQELPELEKAVGMEPVAAFASRDHLGVHLAAPPAAWPELRQRLEALSLPELAPEDLERHRIELGVPAYGAEITGRELPQELRLEAAVDFDKGCYLGQEIVARLHYRGHVNRALTRLRLDRAAGAGASLRAGERAVGAITSVALRADGAVALGIVRREHLRPGAELDAETPEGSVVAVVCDPAPPAG